MAATLCRRVDIYGCYVMFTWTVDQLDSCTRAETRRETLASYVIAGAHTTHQLALDTARRCLEARARVTFWVSELVVASAAALEADAFTHATRTDLHHTKAVNCKKTTAITLIVQ